MSACRVGPRRGAETGCEGRVGAIRKLAPRLQAAPAKRSFEVIGHNGKTKRWADLPSKSSAQVRVGNSVSELVKNDWQKIIHRVPLRVSAGNRALLS